MLRRDRTVCQLRSRAGQQANRYENHCGGVEEGYGGRQIGTDRVTGSDNSIVTGQGLAKKKQI